MVHPNQYEGPQELLASDRIVIVARKNDIFLNSKETVSISANKSVNIDTKEHAIINSPKIYLGLDSVDETQPIGRGEDVRDILSKLIDALDKVCEPVERDPGSIPPALVLGLSMLRGTIDALKETYGSDLKKSISTKTFVE